MSETPPPIPLLRSGSVPASSSAWPWRDAPGSSESAANRASLRSSLRREGAIRALVGGAIGGVFFYFGALTLASVAWAGAGVVLLAALASPDGLYAAIGRALARLGLGLGRLLAILLLTPVFFLFFLPFGRLLRSGRRDRLERWWDPAALSYWHRRDDAPRTKASYEKTF